LVACAAVVSLLLASLRAHADPFADHPQSHNFLSLGAIGDVGGRFAGSAPGTGVVTAGGAELSLSHWSRKVGEMLDSSKYAFGLFGQVEAKNPDGHARFAGGLQGSVLTASFIGLGAELGVATEDGRGPYATTASLHVAPYASLGVLYLALRGEVPLAAMTDGSAYGVGLALVLGLKAPIPIDGGTILDSQLFH
jgi:hypothetical protein